MSINDEKVDNKIKYYTLKKLSEISGLSTREIKKHLIAQTLTNQYTNRGYAIEEEILNEWINNIPNLVDEEKNSIFNINDNTNDLNFKIIEKDISKRKREDNWKKGKLNKIKFADCFCGAGGISLGLAMAGYEPVLGIEIDKYAYETYKQNLGVRYRKINDFGPKDITQTETKEKIIEYLKKEKIQLICGGFPCQGFSLSGSRVITDPRNTLYQDMLDIVKEVKPDFIMMENVTGIITIFEGKVLKKIISDYKEIGYDVSWKELNAADYEVAQSRKRIIFIGNRVNKNNIFPKKIINNFSEYKTCGCILEKYIKWEESKESNHIFSKHSEEMKERLKNVELGKTLYDTYSDSWKKCPPNKPSCTIKGNHGATNIHYSLPRVITPREMAALQSFPDDYIFFGPKQSQLVQIGNAVPPYVARAVGLALEKEILRKSEEEK